MRLAGTRIFAHKTKFGDDTKYMECHPDGNTTRISNDGIEHPGFRWSYSLNSCLQQVWQGKWVEVTSYIYTLPKSTISDHLKDCFGFLCYKRHDRFDEFVDAFHKALLKEMPWLKGMGV